MVFYVLNFTLWQVYFYLKIIDVMNDKRRKNGGKGTNVGNALRWLVKQGKTVAPEILNIAGNITGADSLNKLATAIKGDNNLTQVDKELLLKEIEQDTIEMQETTKRWSNDMMSDSYWSKNIRPLSLAFLTVTLFIYIILDASIEGFKISQQWVDLLQGLMLLVYGGYFGMRSLEKVSKILKK